MKAFNHLAFLLLLLLVAETSLAAKDPVFVRWTGDEYRRGDIDKVVAVLAQKTGFKLVQADFILDEDRDLAFAHYQRWSQRIAGVRVKDMAVRIWTRRSFPRKAIQVEANLEDPTAVLNQQQMLVLDKTTRFASGMRDLSPLVTPDEMNALARQAIAGTEDAHLRGLSWQDYLSKGQLVRELTIRARRGEHVVTILLPEKRIVDQKYKPFPNMDGGHEGGEGEGEISLPAKVYPIYEEYKGQILERQQVMLRHILPTVKRPKSDPYEPLRARRYFGSKYNPTLALTADGRAKGYWSDPMVRAEAQDIEARLPSEANQFGRAEGVSLQGRYATININPNALTQFQGLTLPARFSSHYFSQWKEVEVDGNSDDEMIPTAALLGKPLLTLNDALNRPPTRHPSHDPALYLNQGFDEVQIYYAINQLFDSLHGKGFADPDLSTRPFHAILYDPDINMRDNAYYTSDTINFTTYSPSQLNYARDNTTIWHELGHGVMDRLMGDFLNLADTGGLSEGMADFVAELVIRDVTQDRPFPGQEDQRIINQTGFYLTNEVHDDGEAYGGTMKDILDGAMDQWGQAGLVKMTDLTMEAMRLTRDHPHLTAADWFDHMMFADSLGRRGIRGAGELAPLIQKSLNARNFSRNLADLASYKISYLGKPVDAGEPGSRSHGIPLQIEPTATQHFDLDAVIEDGTNTKFDYPVTLKVQLRGGPLQGAVHWEGEDQSERVYTVTEPGQHLTIPLDVHGTCDEVNTDDGGCSDFAYLLIYNARNPEQPVGKKRFYVRVKPRA